MPAVRSRMAARYRSLTTMESVAVLLVLVTALVHLYEGVEDLGEGVLGVMFILAGLGFLGAIVLFFLDYPRLPLYIVGIFYTGLQFVLYFVLRWPNVYDTLGLFDKIVQLVLMLVLVELFRSERAKSEGDSPETPASDGTMTED
ncbi:hypothetical protein [Haloarchaeobius sp. HME9146]|uniref:DUF7475 family protein n=1 Tax=Haloarchaeobius sp. HME9146 TaxID=2978732 RepID=UPI0021BDFB2D|nr:hypothetical protein [Haloarchaeobius sp. HME9146]MCT9098266.1 hypothetical protein [Haloarchaeobius sp. HME9146]